MASGGLQVEYVPDAGRGFHSVTVKSMSLGNTVATRAAATVPVNEDGILDTGTNVLLVSTSVHQSLQSAMCQDASLTGCAAIWSGKCLALTPSEVASYPDLSMELSTGLELKMTAKDYLLLGSPLASSPNEYCSGIKDGGSAGGSGFIIGMLPSPPPPSLPFTPWLQRNDLRGLLRCSHGGI